MAAVTLPRRRSLLGKVAAAIAARSSTRARSGRVAAVAALAREHVVTVAALASIDLGAFRATSVAGWIVTGVSLLAADFAVRG